MDIRDSQRIKEIRDNTRAMAEAFGRIADTLAEALELYVSTQTETQNSNLTFEKDECAKEYEELGLKELKELIEADRKTESSSEKPNNCEDDDIFEYCPRCGMRILSKWAKDEPQTDDIGNCNICKYVGLEHRCNQCVNGSMFCKVEDEPQKWETPPKFEHKGVVTTCVSVPAFAVEDEPQTERKCIDCKFLTYMFGKTWCNIKCDNPHDKVCDRWQMNEPQTDCAWRRDNA